MSETATPNQTSAVNPWLLAIVVSLAAFMEVLDTTIVNVSLSHIAGTLGASQDESTWVLSSYLVANGIVLPLSGWLSGVMGRKRYFMLCIAGFTAASFACGAATSLGMLIVFRIIQGLAGGGLQPTQQSIILDAFPPAKRGAVFAVTGITMIVAPILGPTLGGYITDNFEWRWIFFMNVPVGVAALWLINRMLEDPPHAQAKGLLSIDYIGLGLIAVGLGSLQLVLDKGQQDDWFSSPFITAMAVVSVVCISCVIAWLLEQKNPIVELRLLARRSFSLGCLLIFVTGFCLYASSALLPVLVQSQFGYDAMQAGLVLSPGGLAVVFLMPIAGKLSGKVQARYLIMTGMIFLSVGLLVTSYITPQSNYSLFVVMRMLQVLGLPFLFIPVSTLAFMGIPKELSDKASALYALSRNLGGSVGIAVLSSYVSRHQQTHQLQLVSHMTPADVGYRNTLAEYSRIFVDHGVAAGAALQHAVGKLYQEMAHQAVILAYNDGFRMMGVVTAALALLTLLMPKNNPRAKPGDTPSAH